MANDDSEEESSGDGSHQSSEVDERTLHRNLIVAEAKADADEFMRSLSEGATSARHGRARAPPFRRQSSAPTPLPRPKPQRPRRISKNNAASGSTEAENAVVDLATGSCSSDRDSNNSSSESDEEAGASASKSDQRTATVHVEQHIESGGESSSSSVEKQTELRRVVEANRQEHHENIYQQARAAAAAQVKTRRRSNGGARGKQRKLDAFLPKHAERAAKLEKVARESSTSWADDLRKVGGTGAANGDRPAHRRNSGGGGASRKRASVKNRKLPHVAPPRWRSGDAVSDCGQANLEAQHDRRARRKSTSDSARPLDDRLAAYSRRHRKRRRSTVPLDEDEDEDEDGGDDGAPQQQQQHEEDENDDANAVSVVQGTLDGKRRRNSRRLLLDSDEEAASADLPDVASDSGSD